jgi:hypothetical protein
MTVLQHGIDLNTSPLTLMNQFASAAERAKLNRTQVIQALVRLGLNLGCSTGEIMKVLTRDESEKAAWIIANDKRIDFLLDVALGLMMDDDLNQEEMILVKRLGIDMGVPPYVVDVMIKEVIDNVALGLNLDQIKEDIEELIDE